MLSGRRLDLLQPSFTDIEIDDIAHGLARVARWNGQTIGEYGFSVAQHSVLVTDLLPDELPTSRPADKLAALLHDAPEYVIGDMISPFKAAMGGSYKDIEAGLQRAIHLRFGLPAELPDELGKAIKRADKVAAFSEAVAVAGFDEPEARKILGYRRRKCVSPLHAWSPNEAKKAFLRRFDQLSIA